MKRALITGVTGQDGSYLAELLLEKGYEVHGVVRRCSTTTTARIEHLRDQITIHHADLTDQLSLIRMFQQVEPNEVYNLAAQSFVPTSFFAPIMTAETTGLGVVRVLEALRLAAPEARFYQASSSEMFGKVVETPQNEETPFYPRSPYGVSKVFGHYITINYRESYNLHASSGILYNHESERRGIEFVTRKISRHVALIKKGLLKELVLGNIAAERDWGHARDYVKAMWMMLQQDEPDDYVVATGEKHSVRDFCKVAFEHVGLNWEEFVRCDKKFERPAEVEMLLGDPAKARNKLGWTNEVSFEQLVKLMVDKDIERIERDPAGINRPGFWYID